MASTQQRSNRISKEEQLFRDGIPRELDIVHAQANF